MTSVGAEVVLDANLILCRTRLEEAEQHLRAFVASLAPENEIALRAADALAYVQKAIELLRLEEPGRLPPT
jgi:hypothetical protein